MVALLALSTSIGASLAFADVVTVDGDAVAAGTQFGSSATSIVRGGSATARYWLVASSAGGDVTGCNATSANPVNVPLTATKVTLSASSVSFTACDTSPTGTNVTPVTYTIATDAPLGRAGAGITADTPTGGVSGSRFTAGGNGDFTIDVLPRAGTNVAAAATGANQVKVTWDASPDQSDITDYVVNRTDGGVATQIGIVPKTTSPLAFTDSVSTAADHTYVIRARFNAGGGSTFSSPASATATYTADSTPPVITPALSPSANPFGWHKTELALTWSVTDGDSTITSSAGCVAVTVTDETAGTDYTCSATSGGGFASKTITVKLDKTNPTIAGTRVTAANANGWNNGDVVVSFACNDVLSGIDGSCPFTQTVSTEGTGQSVTGSAFDRAGNSASDTVTGINIDKTKPQITAAASPAANPNGWNRANVTVSFACSDDRSGIDGSCPASQTLSSEGTGLSASASVSDKAGNSDSAGVAGIKIDKTDPTISATRATPANAFGWNDGSVTVDYTCSDDRSGLADSCPGETIATEGSNQTSSRTVHDKAGNSASDAVSDINIDKTDPTISSQLSPDANAFGWRKSDVTVSYACADALAGIDLAGSACDDDVLATEGANLGAEGSAKDKAGNAKSVSVTGVKIDKTAPTVTPHRSTEPNLYGWNNGPVTVSYDCVELLSGLDGDCAADDTLSDEGANQEATGSAHDKAGNLGSGGVYVNIDKTAPTVTGSRTPVANAYGWNKDSVNVHFSCSDTLSTLLDACPADTLVTTEGAGQSVSSGSISDKAGNSASDSVSDINIDKTEPTITASRVTPANGFGWNNGAVTVSYACADALSGVDPASAGCDDDVVSTEGAGQSASGTAEDKAGNSASDAVSDINIDQTDPTISSQLSPDANAFGWRKSDVTVSYACADALAGIDLAGSACDDDVLATEGANLGAEGTAKDKAGNTKSVSVTGVKIDKTAPTVTFTAPGDGFVTSAGSTTVAFSASDDLSGIQAAKLDGSAITGTGSYSVSVPLVCGSNVFTATATDKAGNDAGVTRTITRSCMYPSDVLLPVATLNGSQANPFASNLGAFKIKSTIPVKFRAYWDAAKTQMVTAPEPGAVVRLTTGKADGSTDSLSDVVVSAGSANTDNVFRWSGSPDYQYVYNLATQGKSSGTYWVQMTVYGSDGSLETQSAKQYFVLRS